MKYTIIMVILILLQGCNNGNPVSLKNEIEYKIIFVSDRDSDGQIHMELGTKCEIYTMDIDGTNQTRITENDTWDNTPKYSPNGNKIVYSAATDWLMSDIHIMDSDGTNIINLGTGKNPTVSNDNSKVLYQTSGLIGIINIDGSNKKVLTSWADSIYSTIGQDFPIQFSSNDQEILFISKRSNNYEIYTMSVNGNNIKQLTNNSSYDGSCSFSPDDSKILFVSYESGKAQLYIMESDGSNQKQLTTTEDFNTRPSFSPDGTEIVFLSYRDGQTEVYIMNSEGTNQKRLTNNEYNKENPKFSPDGLNIVYQQTVEDAIDILLINVGCGEIKNLTNGSANNYNPSFSPVLN